MTRFIDTYPPEEMPSWPCASAPRFNTQITQVDSGAEQANQRWEHPLYKFTMPEVIREQLTFEAVRDQWLIMRGPAHTFPWRDELDFASVSLEAPTIEPVVSSLDQIIGTGDGVTQDFQLIKTYQRGPTTYVRNLHLPVVATVVVAVAGLDPTASSPPNGWSISRPGGVVHFDIPPAPGQVITAGYYFDVEVRFESDDAFEGIVQSYAIAGYASLTLVEIRPCLGGL